MRDKVDKDVSYWREKYYNDTMSAKKSGWDDAVSFFKSELDKLTVIDDDKIYSATVQGFGKKVEATNPTDEIELKRYEGAKQVAYDQLWHTKKQLLDLMGD